MELLTFLKKFTFLNTQQTDKDENIIMTMVFNGGPNKDQDVSSLKTPVCGKDYDNSKPKVVYVYCSHCRAVMPKIVYTRKESWEFDVIRVKCHVCGTCVRVGTCINEFKILYCPECSRDTVHAVYYDEVYDNRGIVCIRMWKRLRLLDVSDRNLLKLDIN